MLGKPRGVLETGDACGKRLCQEDMACLLPVGLQMLYPKQLTQIYCKQQPGHL